MGREIIRRDEPFLLRLPAIRDADDVRAPSIWPAAASFVVRAGVFALGAWAVGIEFWREALSAAIDAVVVLPTLLVG